MKCLPSCGYREKPDNITKLTRHVEECLAEGACAKLKKPPVVIWKDGEFTVALKATKKDRVFPLDLIIKEPIELTDDMIKTFGEVVAPSIKGVNATRTTGRGSNEVKIKAKLDEDFI